MPVQVIYITAALLFIAVFPMPNEFSAYIKVVAFGTFAWGCYRNLSHLRRLLPWVYALLAILFNPIIEITLNKEFWIPLCLGAGVILLLTKRHIAEDPH